MSVTYEDIKLAVSGKGLSGKIICIHSSLKSFGYIEGGAITLIQAFLDEGCTLVVPTFSYDFITLPPKGRLPRQNGCDYSKVDKDIKNEVKIFCPECNEITRDMGAIPTAVLSLKDRIRGNHPISSFTSVGHLAQEVIRNQSSENLYSPFEIIYSLGGSIVLMGVDLTKATEIHFAEKMTGRNLFIRWARNAAGIIEKNRVGGCSEGFNRLLPHVLSIEDTALVGGSHWRIYDFRQFVDTVADIIRADPDITHCEDPNCIRCNDAIKGGPVEELGVDAESFT